MMGQAEITAIYDYRMIYTKIMNLSNSQLNYYFHKHKWCRIKAVTGAMIYVISPGS